MARPARVLLKRRQSRCTAENERDELVDHFCPFSIGYGQIDRLSPFQRRLWAG